MERGVRIFLQTTVILLAIRIAAQAQPVLVNEISTNGGDFTAAATSATCSSSGSIFREYWEGVPGSRVSDIPVSTAPTGTGQLTVFEGPTNAGTHYGSRVRGYICPPVTGEYTFWIASNDHSELWLSTDGNPANNRRIAYVTGATNPRQWDKYASQKSAGVLLQAGTRYYIEALHKQGVGTDHFAVGWQLPNGVMERPMPGFRLSPFTGQLIPEVRITSPVEGETFTAPARIQISGTVEGFRGSRELVELYAGSLNIGTTYSDNGTFTFNWNDVETGAYPLTAVVEDFTGATDVSEEVNIIVNNACTPLGRITREYWSNVQGNRVTDIPVDEEPSGETELSVFETGSLGTHYGARIRGFICAPLTGNYAFWISSNDHSELWISTDDDPANKQLVAYVSGATNPRQWDKFATQRSWIIPLVEGQKYYIEALHKQGVGTDHLSVGWHLPDGTVERPMQADRLSPYNQENGERESYVFFPANKAADVDPSVLQLEARRIVGASRYTVELSSVSDFSGSRIVVSSVDDFQSTFIVKNLESGTTYYTRVKTDVSGYGPVTTFNTRQEISELRLWGLTTTGGTGELGTVFSYSIDDNSFVKHYDQQLYLDEYEQRFMGSLISGPDGVLYGHADHDYSAKLFTLSPQGQVEWWPDETYFYEGKLFLASNNHIYASNLDEMVPGVIDIHDVERKSLLLNQRMFFFEDRSNGADPGMPLIELSNGYLYGTAGRGGMNDGGVIYRFKLDRSGFEILHYFREAGSGMNPYSGLTEYNGFLYGTTLYGGEGGDNGTIFRIKPDGTQFSKLHDFDGANGAHPEGELLVMGNALYGTTNAGGASDKGTVFKINPDGSGFVTLHAFSGTDGTDPSRGLVHDRDGNLYGMTSYGGVNNLGVIFKVNSSGAGFTKLFDFSNVSGGNPNGMLVIREDLYSPSPATVNAVEAQEPLLRISVHPNPSTDNFNVMVSSPGMTPIQMVVSDQYGQVVKTYTLTSDIPMQVGSELQKGIYIMKIIQGREITTQRIVKK